MRCDLAPGEERHIAAPETADGTPAAPISIESAHPSPEWESGTPTQDSPEIE